LNQIIKNEYPILSPQRSKRNESTHNFNHHEDITFKQWLNNKSNKISKSKSVSVLSNYNNDEDNNDYNYKF